MNWQGLQLSLQGLAGRGINAAGEGIVIALAVWMALRLIRPHAAARFAIWFSTLLALAALSFISHDAVLNVSREAGRIGSTPGLALPNSWAAVLVLVWAAGSAVLLLRLCIGLWRVRALRRTCRGLEGADASAAMAQELREFSQRERVTVCRSNRFSVPSALGFVRPAIVIPEWMLSQISVEEVRAILVHELAHLRRRDHWTNLIQQLLKAIFFFHPAMWWIESRLTLEREVACDEIAVVQSPDPKSYASSLVSLAERLEHARGLGFVQALIGRVGELSIRVARILEAKSSGRRGLWIPVVSTNLVLLMLLGIVSSVPDLVHFRGEQPEQFASVSAKLRTAPNVQTQSMAPLVAARAQRAAFQPGPTRVRRRASHPEGGRLAAATRERMTWPVIGHAHAAVSAVPEALNPSMIVVLESTATSDFDPAIVWTVWVVRVQPDGHGTAQYELRPSMIVNLI